ncbi:MAG TPA: hypothetical protein VHQ43_02130 [Solirubrobacterales bacterium]|jgi:hypothetical protein|nr:hypothetical protein [Solirubrobacterales bacterium]
MIKASGCPDQIRRAATESFRRALTDDMQHRYGFLVSDREARREKAEEPPQGEEREIEDDSEEHDVALASLRKIFQAAEDLKDQPAVDEQSFSSVAHTAPDDFFVFEALDEVQKMATGLLPLSGLAASAKGDDGDAVTRIIEESFVDQSALWQRKLAEVLADVICFRSTRSAEFFRDYLLLARLDQVLAAQEDQRTFWGAESANQRHQIQRLVSEIAELERDGLALDRAWYRQRRAPLPENPIAGQLFTSFRKQLKNSLSLANESEKVALGLSYGSLFARTSASLHARPGRLGSGQGRSPMGELQIPILIGINVLVGCQRLMGSVPGGHNEFFRTALDQNAEAEKLVGRLTKQRASPGDLVIAHGELCEVLDVAERAIWLQVVQGALSDQAVDPRYRRGLRGLTPGSSLLRRHRGASHGPRADGVGENLGTNRQFHAGNARPRFASCLPTQHGGTLERRHWLQGGRHRTVSG